MAYTRTRSRRRPARRRTTRRSYKTYLNNRYFPNRRRVSRAERQISRREAALKRPMMSKFTLAQLNPFSEKVAGVKIPDVNTQPSSTVVVEDEYALTTGVAETSATQMFRPPLVGNAVRANFVSSVDWAWPAAFGGSTASGKQATIASNNTAIRVCAHGARITCALAPTTVIGFVHICIVTESEYGKTTWSVPTSVSQMQTSQWYKRIPLAVLTQKPYTIVNKILDHNAFRYFDPGSDLVANATDMTLHTSGWANILIAVTGVPASTAVLSIETLVHLETLPSPGSAQTVTPAANASSASVEQATNIANSTPAVHEEGMFDSFLSGAYSAASGVGNNLYEASLNGARQAGFNAIQGLGGAAYNWLQGTNNRMIQY